jgi:hypothetical protein
MIDDRDPYEIAGEMTSGGGQIIGDLLKYSKGRLFVGRENLPLALGTEFTFMPDTARWGFLLWLNGAPIADGDHMRQVADGLYTSRYDLSNVWSLDEKTWPLGPSGTPLDPLRDTRNCICVEVATNKVCTFSINSKGGIEAFRLLLKEYGKHRKLTGDSEYPVYRLSTGSYQPRDKLRGITDFPIFAGVPISEETSCGVFKLDYRPKSAEPMRWVPADPYRQLLARYINMTTGGVAQVTASPHVAPQPQIGQVPREAPGSIYTGDLSQPRGQTEARATFEARKESMYAPMEPTQTMVNQAIGPEAATKISEANAAVEAAKRALAAAEEQARQAARTANSDPDDPLPF